MVIPLSVDFVVSNTVEFRIFVSFDVRDFDLSWKRILIPLSCPWLVPTNRD